MPPREIATVENCIAEARQMQESGEYINGTIFHLLADEVERLQERETELISALEGERRLREQLAYALARTTGRTLI